MHFVGHLQVLRGWRLVLGDHLWTYVGAVGARGALLTTGGRWKQFVWLFRAHPGAMVGVNATNELVNLGGGLGVRYALLLAPVSLVQAISSTTTLFVFASG